MVKRSVVHFQLSIIRRMGACSLGGNTAAKELPRILLALGRYSFRYLSPLPLPTAGSRWRGFCRRGFNGGGGIGRKGTAFTGLGYPKGVEPGKIYARSTFSSTPQFYFFGISAGWAGSFSRVPHQGERPRRLSVAGPGLVGSTQLFRYVHS